MTIRSGRLPEPLFPGVTFYLINTADVRVYGHKRSCARALSMSPKPQRPPPHSCLQHTALLDKVIAQSHTFGSFSSPKDPRPCRTPRPGNQAKTSSTPTPFTHDLINFRGGSFFTLRRICGRSVATGDLPKTRPLCENLKPHFLLSAT